MIIITQAIRNTAIDNLYDRIWRNRSSRIPPAPIPIPTFNRVFPFKFIIDEIYEKYKRGEDIYLECYCKPERCHGDIIKEKLEKRLMKERIKEAKERRNRK